jgi:hypothetical protein
MVDAKTPNHINVQQLYKGNATQMELHGTFYSPLFGPFNLVLCRVLKSL